MGKEDVLLVFSKYLSNYNSKTQVKKYAVGDESMQCIFIDCLNMKPKKKWHRVGGKFDRNRLTQINACMQ